jgi:hypothetical protein
MWSLTKLEFENYRTFERKEELALAPLTVLIGRNSSGKSAIARLPLLLRRGILPGGQAPLELEFDGHDFGASFVDVVHGRVPTRAIRFGATVSDGATSHRMSVAIGYWDEFQMQGVREFQLEVDGSSIFDLAWNQEGNPVEGLRYRIAPMTSEEPIRFEGLIPVDVGRLIGDVRGGHALGARFAIQDALRDLIYLGPFRDAPARAIRLPESAVTDVGLRGGQAARALANDWLRHGAKVLERVGAYYRDHLGGWLLDLERDGQSFSVVLRHPRDRTVAVNLQDAGVGLSQVLPVVVQRELDRAAGRAGGLDIVEQPELHLHPGAHGDLADLYIDAIRSGSTRFLVETHSENFILRIRRRIAERALLPTEVALYWVDDDPNASPRVRRIGIDEAGQLDFWPRGVFAEDLAEVRAIRGAQREHAP